VSQCQKGKSNLDFTEARDSEWQWHQLGFTQVCTSLQTDNHFSTPPLSFFTGWMPFLSPNQQHQSTEGVIGVISACVCVCWQGDGDAFIEIAEQINAAWTSDVKSTELNADLLRQFAYQATGNICPMQAVIGGIAAQEVMKVRDTRDT